MSRRKSVRLTISAEDGTAEFGLYSPPDAAGAQVVAATRTVSLDDIHPDLRAQLLLQGFATYWAGRYQRLDEPSVAELAKSFTDFAAVIKDGTWTPGRGPSESEPTDLELAIAEATGRPIHVVQQHLEDLLAKPKLDAAGNIMKDKRGRIMHAHKRADALNGLSNDPKVRPILARLTAERAKRMAADAKKPAAEGASALDMFGLGSEPALAAAAAQ